MADNNRKIRVFKENGKTPQVTHWDLDYLSKDDVRDLYEQGTKNYQRKAKQERASSTSNQKLSLLLITIGCLLLAGSLYVASII